MQVGSTLLDTIYFISSQLVRLTMDQMIEFFMRAIVPEVVFSVVGPTLL